MTLHNDIGPRIDDNGVRGWACFEWLPDALQRAEDSTHAADRARWEAGWAADSALTWRTVRMVVPGIRTEGVDATPELVRVFDRAATETERMLLEHLSYELPDELTTRVTFIGPAHNRRWPQLESETP